MLVIFAVSQYGKFFSYAYCVAESEVKGITCDCAKQLTAGSTTNSDHPAQLVQKDKYEEVYITTEIISVNLYALQTASLFTNKHYLLAEGFQSGLLHPPAVS
jgi:hypothetical protein